MTSCWYEENLEMSSELNYLSKTIVETKSVRFDGVGWESKERWHEMQKEPLEKWLRM